MTVTVDVHAHVILPDVEAAVADRPGLAAHKDLDARRNGARSLAVSGQMVGARIGKLTRVPVRLADMDAQGVDVQIVSPSPSHYHYWADADLAREVWQLADQGTAAHCAQAPGRLLGLGLAPLQHPAQLVESLDHALDLGLKGVEISSHAPGVELSDPRLEPFWARAAVTGAVVFLHPFGCTLDERLDRWYLSNIVGQPAENAVALSHLIFAGVLDRHPDLKLLASHGGGYLPTYIGRADHGWTVRSEAHDCAQPPSSYLRRIWFDSLVYTPTGLRHLAEAVGAHRLVLGSDYPFDMGVDNPLERLADAGFPPADELAIRGGTAASLFDLPAPVPTRGARS